MAPHREPIHDVHLLTGVNIEVFYADRTMETFGWGGAGWYWWVRRRGFAPDGAAQGPFPTGYTAYRAAANGGEPAILFGTRSTTRLQTCAPPPIHSVNADTVRTRWFRHNPI
jgi:hypothetical protein